MTFRIYLHTCTVTGKGYVGQTHLLMEKRWAKHVRNARVRHGCRAFEATIRKYGPDAFEHRLLVVVNTRSAANAAERKWIARLKTRAPNGYNLAPGGWANDVLIETRSRIGKASRAAAARKSPEERSAPALALWASMSPEQRTWRRQRLRDGWAKKTPAEKRQAGLNAAASREAKMTEGQRLARAENGRHANDGISPEVLSARGRKASLARWAKAS